jgi:hypothetical protein
LNRRPADTYCLIRTIRRPPCPPIAVIADPHGLDPAPAVELLTAAGFEVRVADTRDPDTIAGLAADAVAFVTGYARLDAELLARLPALQIVATMSSGVDMIDLAAARERGLWVCNLPDASTEEVAVHALAMTRHRSAGPDEIRIGADQCLARWPDRRGRAGPGAGFWAPVRRWILGTCSALAWMSSAASRHSLIRRC